jgi:uncharacterized protein involved in response to NO
VAEARPRASLRQEPWRLYFPLGLVLAWAGVLHWVFHGLGLLPDYKSVFHAVVQIQGFLICFAAGFLLTAIPRRTGTPPPAAWQLVACALAPLGSTVAAWFERWALSQSCWIVLVAVLADFAVRRFRAAGAARRPPNSFVWIPLALAMGVAGSLLIAAYGALGDAYYGLHELGRLLLLQGMFLGLVVGAGGMVIPLLTRGRAAADGSTGWRDRRARALHVAAALLLAASFWWEHAVSLRGGLALRAALLCALLASSAGVHRLPTLPGAHRWWIWLAAWMLPAGYVLAALFPAQKKAGLHVVFLGGLALMALSVGLHVTLAHGGRPERLSRSPWQVRAFGSLVLASMVLRALVDFDPPRFSAWIAASAAAFLLATLFWVAALSAGRTPPTSPRPPAP